jgi:ribosome-interacting GTPase 1
VLYWPPAMPTNVTPDYKRAEEAFRAAKTTDEKIARLEDMITLLPKHKGTDHLFADLKRRLAKLKEEAEAGAGRHGGHAGPEIGREGAAQVVLVGATGAGKSSILQRLTHAQPEIGDWPFVTRILQPGMAHYEDAPIQLVDSPAIAPGTMPVHLLGVVRGSDGVLFVADLSRDTLLDDFETTIALFAEHHVRLVRERADPHDRDAVRCLVVANKTDAPGAADRLTLLRELVADRLETVPCSCAPDAGERRPLNGSVADLPGVLFRWLRIVRVYTRTPGQHFERTKPFTVFEGGTVGDVCALVHKDFAERLRFARLWRGPAAAALLAPHGGGGEPLTVSRAEPVHDGDVLELHL